MFFNRFNLNKIFFFFFTEKSKKQCDSNNTQTSNSQIRDIEHLLDTICNDDSTIKPLFVQNIEQQNNVTASTATDFNLESGQQITTDTPSTILQFQCNDSIPTHVSELPQIIQTTNTEDMQQYNNVILTINQNLQDHPNNIPLTAIVPTALQQQNNLSTNIDHINTVHLNLENFQQQNINVCHHDVFNDLPLDSNYHDILNEFDPLKNNFTSKSVLF